MTRDLKVWLLPLNTLLIENRISHLQSNFSTDASKISIVVNVHIDKVINFANRFMLRTIRLASFTIKMSDFLLLTEFLKYFYTIACVVIVDKNTLRENQMRISDDYWYCYKSESRIPRRVVKHIDYDKWLWGAY